MISPLLLQIPSDVPLPSSFRGDPVGLFWVIVIVGFATAAFVQWAKDFFGWRRRFHAKTVRDWLRQRNPRVENAVQELEILAGAENDERFREPRHRLPAYSLPAEQLCGQIASAAEVAVAMPNRYRDLFSALVLQRGFISPEEIDDYVVASQIRRKSSGNESAGPVTQRATDLAASEEGYGEMRAQLMVQAQRAVDNLQIIIGEHWRKIITKACVGFCFAFSILIVWFLLIADPSVRDFSVGHKVTIGIFTILVITIAGTLAAPIAHDLMRAVRAFRR